jgi:hypothetical protein
LLSVRNFTLGEGDCQARMRACRCEERTAVSVSQLDSRLIFFFWFALFDIT